MPSASGNMDVKYQFKLSDAVTAYFSRASNDESDGLNVVGGILECTRYGWFGAGAHLQVVCLKTGQKVAAWSFGKAYNENVNITCVCEISLPYNTGIPLLAVGLECALSGGMVCVFSMRGSRVLRAINVLDPVTSICLVDAKNVLQGPISALDGVLSVGTARGEILLLDLRLQDCIKSEMSMMNPYATLGEENCCGVVRVDPSLDVGFTVLRESANSNGEHIAVVLAGFPSFGQVSSVLMSPSLSALVVGYTKGHLVLWDLLSLRCVHTISPTIAKGPIECLAFQDASDDPKALCFLWAFHRDHGGPVAIMYGLLYQRKDRNGPHTYLYQNFVSSRLCFSITMGTAGAEPLSCYAVNKSCSDAGSDESVLSLCFLSWTDPEGPEMCVFDLNQWYKSQMPETADASMGSSFLVVLPLVPCQGDRHNVELFSARLDVSKISTFKSLQQYEEHYYPISLGFECVVLSKSSVACLKWAGLQTCLLRALTAGGPALLLAPTKIYKDCLKAALRPMISDHSYSEESPIDVQRDYLLSIAMDNGYYDFLMTCAKAWADGSYVGAPGALIGGLKPNTIPEWVRRQAGGLKQLANKLCVPLFDYSGTHLDRDAERQLRYCCSHFKQLAILFKNVLRTCTMYMSADVISELTEWMLCLQIGSEYYAVLQWLLNVGLLPEAPLSSPLNLEKTLVPYPAEILVDYYKKRRSELHFEASEGLGEVTASWGSRLLFIDSLIEHECGGQELRSQWEMDGGCGLYPPRSIQALLRTYLLPNVSITNKHTLFVYLFLDLAAVLPEETYASALEKFVKFPSVFGMTPEVIKNTQAFWHLDKQIYKVVIEELIDPISFSRRLPVWQHTLLLGSLIAQGQSKEALQMLRYPGPPAPHNLHLKILLENHLFSDAFHLQRKSGGKEFFVGFLEGCAKLGQLRQVLRLFLNAEEEASFEEFLLSQNNRKAEDLLVSYYLQRSRYVEAISVNKQLGQKQMSRSGLRGLKEESTRDIIVSAFEATLPAVTRKVSTWCNQKQSVLNKWTQVARPTPLSVNIVDMNVHGVRTQSSVVQASIERARETWGTRHGRGLKRGLDVEDTPFLRTPKSFRIDSRESPLVYPVLATNQQRRTSQDNSSLTNEQYVTTPLKRARADGPMPRQSISKNTISLNQSGTPYNFSQAKTTPGFTFSKGFNTPEVLSRVSTSFTLSSLSSPSSSPRVSLSMLNTPIIERKKMSKETTETSAQIQRSILKVHSMIRNFGSPCSTPRDSSSRSLENLASASAGRSITFQEPADDSSINDETEVDGQEASGAPPEILAKASTASLGATTRPSIHFTGSGQDDHPNITHKSLRSSSPSTGDDNVYSVNSSAENVKPESSNRKFSILNAIRERRVQLPDIIAPSSEKVHSFHVELKSNAADDVCRDVTQSLPPKPVETSIADECSPMRRRKIVSKGPVCRRSTRDHSRTPEKSIFEPRVLRSRSKTPEVSMNADNRSRQSRSQDRATPNTKTKEKRSLSRIAMEANALKLKSAVIDTTYKKVDKSTMELQGDGVVETLKITTTLESENVYSKEITESEVVNTHTHTEHKYKDVMKVLEFTESDDIVQSPYEDQLCEEANPEDLESEDNKVKENNKEDVVRKVLTENIKMTDEPTCAQSLYKTILLDSSSESNGSLASEHDVHNLEGGKSSNVIEECDINTRSSVSEHQEESDRACSSVQSEEGSISHSEQEGGLHEENNMLQKEDGDALHAEDESASNSKDNIFQEAEEDGSSEKNKMLHMEREDSSSEEIEEESASQEKDCMLHEEEEGRSYEAEEGSDEEESSKEMSSEEDNVDHKFNHAKLGKIDSQDSENSVMEILSSSDETNLNDESNISKEGSVERMHGEIEDEGVHHEGSDEETGSEETGSEETGFEDGEYEESSESSVDIYEGLGFENDPAESAQDSPNVINIAMIQESSEDSENIDNEPEEEERLGAVSIELNDAILLSDSSESDQAEDYPLNDVHDKDNLQTLFPETSEVVVESVVATSGNIQTSLQKDVCLSETIDVKEPDDVVDSVTGNAPDASSKDPTDVVNIAIDLVVEDIKADVRESTFVGGIGLSGLTDEQMTDCSQVELSSRTAFLDALDNSNVDILERPTCLDLPKTVDLVMPKHPYVIDLCKTSIMERDMLDANYFQDQRDDFGKTDIFDKNYSLISEDLSDVQSTSHANLYLSDDDSIMEVRETLVEGKEAVKVKELVQEIERRIEVQTEQLNESFITKKGTEFSGVKKDCTNPIKNEDDEPLVFENIQKRNADEQEVLKLDSLKTYSTDPKSLIETVLETDNEAKHKVPLATDCKEVLVMKSKDNASKAIGDPLDSITNIKETDNEAKHITKQRPSIVKENDKIMDIESKAEDIESKAEDIESEAADIESKAEDIAIQSVPIELDNEAERMSRYAVPLVRQYDEISVMKSKDDASKTASEPMEFVKNIQEETDNRVQCIINQEASVAKKDVKVLVIELNAADCDTLQKNSNKATKIGNEAKSRITRSSSLSQINKSIPIVELKIDNAASVTGQSTETPAKRVTRRRSTLTKTTEPGLLKPTNVPEDMISNIGNKTAANRRTRRRATFTEGAVIEQEPIDVPEDIIATYTKPKPAFRHRSTLGNIHDASEDIIAAYTKTKHASKRSEGNGNDVTEDMIAASTHNKPAGKRWTRRKSALTNIEEYAILSEISEVPAKITKKRSASKSENSGGESGRFDNIFSQSSTRNLRTRSSSQSDIGQVHIITPKRTRSVLTDVQDTALSPDVDDLSKSGRSKRRKSISSKPSTQSKATVAVIEEEASGDINLEDYSTNSRRLTRNQEAIMKACSPKQLKHGSLKRTKSERPNIKETGAAEQSSPVESGTGTTVSPSNSQISRASSITQVTPGRPRRISFSKAQEALTPNRNKRGKSGSREHDDAGSHTSVSTTRSRTRLLSDASGDDDAGSSPPKILKTKLSVIDEETNSNSSAGADKARSDLVESIAKTPKKRGRPRKATTLLAGTPGKGEV